MQTEVHEYDGGGVRSRGYLALPEGSGKRPGILIVHEAPGLDAHPKRRADMLAKLGYVALAADLYGGGVVGEGPQEAFKLMGPLRDDPDLLRRRMRASFDALASVAGVDQTRLAAIGYCFGGAVGVQVIDERRVQAHHQAFAGRHAGRFLERLRLNGKFIIRFQRIDKMDALAEGFAGYFAE